MSLEIRALVDGAMEGRGWKNSDLAREISRKYELPDGTVTSEQIYEWRQFESQPRAGLTLAALNVLSLLEIDPRKLGLGMREKP